MSQTFQRSCKKLQRQFAIVFIVYTLQSIIRSFWINGTLKSLSQRINGDTRNGSKHTFVKFKFIACPNINAPPSSVFKQFSSNFSNAYQKQIYLDTGCISLSNWCSTIQKLPGWISKNWEGSFDTVGIWLYDTVCINSKSEIAVSGFEI